MKEVAIDAAWSEDRIEDEIRRIDKHERRAEEKLEAAQDTTRSEDKLDDQVIERELDRIDHADLRAALETRLQELRSKG